MTTLLEMPRVRECAVFLCAYNHTGDCHAFAITVGSDHAHCETYVQAPAKAGMESVTAQVGACKRADCRHNDGLECQAPGITVGPDRDSADCLTYDPVS
jgi:Domain of Unknown Function (DUF1540)